jgi:hypothetical protein
MTEQAGGKGIGVTSGEPGELTREFGWWDMFVAPEDDPRSTGTQQLRGERATLVTYLADARLTLQLKCAGLDAEQLARRSVPPSNLSLLGLVRHLANVEQVWFRLRMAGEKVPQHYRTEAEPNGDIEGAAADPALVTEAWETWRSEVAFAERYVTEAPDLDLVGVEGDVLRAVVVHLIEEYGRHNGHADLLRERIDGRVGQ